MADQTIPFGGIYYDLNLKAVQDKQKGMGEGEANLSPEMIAYGLTGELQPYYGQETATGRSFRPALSQMPSEGTQTRPALTGGGGGGGTQNKSAMDYISQYGLPALEAGAGIAKERFQPAVSNLQIGSLTGNEAFINPDTSEDFLSPFHEGVSMVPGSSNVYGKEYPIQGRAVSGGFGGTVGGTIGGMVPGLL